VSIHALYTIMVLSYVYLCLLYFDWMLIRDMVEIMIAEVDTVSLLAM